VDHAPLGLLLLSPLAMIVAGILLPPPDAHWSDHMRSAAAAGGCVAAIAVGAYLVRGRLTVAPILILGGLTAGLGLQVILRSSRRGSFPAPALCSFSRGPPFGSGAALRASHVLGQSPAL